LTRLLASKGLCSMESVNKTNCPKPSAVHPHQQGPHTCSVTWYSRHELILCHCVDLVNRRPTNATSQYDQLGIAVVTARCVQQKGKRMCHICGYSTNITLWHKWLERWSQPPSKDSSWTEISICVYIYIYIYAIVNFYQQKLTVKSIWEWALKLIFSQSCHIKILGHICPIPQFILFCLLLDCAVTHSAPDVQVSAKLHQSWFTFGLQKLHDIHSIYRTAIELQTMQYNNMEHSGDLASLTDRQFSHLNVKRH
jgi:hypothetical protein